jgi:hypothetical protein
MNKTNEFFSKINGSTFCEGAQDAIRVLNQGDPLKFLREPTNKYDPNAIALYNIEGKRLGFIPKDTAINLSKNIDGGDQVEISVSEVTGKDKNNVGCNILVKVYTNEDEIPSNFNEASEADIY